MRSKKKVIAHEKLLFEQSSLVRLVVGHVKLFFENLNVCLIFIYRLLIK